MVQKEVYQVSNPVTSPPCLAGTAITFGVGVFSNHNFQIDLVRTTGSPCVALVLIPSTARLYASAEDDTRQRCWSTISSVAPATENLALHC